MVPRCFFNLMLCLLQAAFGAIVFGSATARAEEASAERNQRPDVVVVRSARGDGSQRNESNRRIRGQITRWQGSSLTISAGARERQIDNAQIVTIETTWSPTAIEARQQLSVNAFARSAELLRQSIDQEQRPWAKVMLRADLVRALLAMDQPAAACEQFLALLRDDPNTRFLNVAPLAWTDGSESGSLGKRATDWLDSEFPAVQLLGASYLIGTAQQEVALQTLEQLSQDLDQRIAALASAQVWRTRREVDIRVIEQWKQKLLSMPKGMRAGPNYVLASHFETADRYDDAITTWMRLPILFEDRPDLAAAALYRVARLMHNTKEEESANLVRQELVRRFPDSAWTQRADRLK